MTKEFWKAAFGWGIGLWAFGYILGFVLFPFVPQNAIGWIIMPIGILAALWILIKKVKLTSFNQYFWLGIIWALIAIVFDNFFLVKLLRPADGYYKLDVYLYYALTFVLPILVGFKKTKRV